MKLYDILKEELESDQEEHSQFPLSDYFEENYSVDDEKIFLQLANKQKELNPNFNYYPVVFSSNKKLFVTMPDIRKKRVKYVHEVNSDGSIDDGKEISEYMSDISMNQNYDEFFGEDFEQKYSDDFWGNAPILFHGSSDIESVLDNGLEARNESRGLNNRHVGSAVFLTSEQDNAETYGDVVAIDTAAMKKDGLTPFVTQEPDIFAEEMLGAIAHILDYDDYYYESGDAGVDHDTVIMMSDIPAKYLSEV